MCKKEVGEIEKVYATLTGKSRNFEKTDKAAYEMAY